MSNQLPPKPDTLIAEGRYPARAVDWKLSETLGGKEQVAIEFAFTADGKAASRLWFGFFTDGTWARTFESLKACGWRGTDPLELDTPQADLSANEVSIVIEHERYEGKWRDRIAFVNAQGGINITRPLAPEKRQAFAQRVKGLFLSAEAGGPPSTTRKQAAPARTPEPPPLTDLDAPPF